MRAGFLSDVHASGYRFANLSPTPRELSLDRFGLELLTPEIPFAHAFQDDATVHMPTDLEETCESIARLSAHDAAQWRVLYDQWLAAKDAISSDLNQPPLPL